MNRVAARAPVRMCGVEGRPCNRVRIGVLSAVLAAGPAIGIGCTESTKPTDRLIDVSTDRINYRPYDRIVVSTRVATADTTFDDHCGGGVEGFEYLGTWNGSFGGGRTCLRGQPVAGRDRIPIPPGTVHMDTFYVNERAYTGTWRVELWLRDRAGVLFPLEQRVSNTFRVEGTWTP